MQYPGTSIKPKASMKLHITQWLVEKSVKVLASLGKLLATKPVQVQANLGKSRPA